MRTWIALFLKEWRQKKLFILIFFNLLIFMGGFGLLVGFTIPGMALFMGIPLYAALVGLPLLLNHSLRSEWDRNTCYTLLSLPIPRYRIALTKLLATGAMGMILLALFSLLLFVTPKGGGTVSGSFSSSPATQMWLLVAGYFLCILCLVLGMVLAVHGVNLRLNRHQAVVVWALHAICWLLYSLPLFLGLDALTGMQGHELSIETASISISEVVIHFGFFIYTLGWGTMFTILGVWLYHRYAEI